MLFLLRIIRKVLNSEVVLDNLRKDKKKQKSANAIKTIIST